MRTQTALEGLCIAVLAMLHSSLNKGIDKEINCTYPELKYSIINKTSGSDKVLRCSQCRECGLGKEPEVPCGTTLGIDDPHGGCNDCGEGMYSNTSDSNACKMCRYQLCFERQLYEGNCTKEKDDSHCLPKCEAGYVMNKEQTKCEVDFSEMQNLTNISNSSLPPTTKPADITDQKYKKNELRLTVIVVIGSLALVAVLVLIICVCYRLRILEPSPGEESDPDLRMHDEPAPAMKYPKQEGLSKVNGSSTMIVIPFEETASGFEQTSIESDSTSYSSVEPTTPLVHPAKPNIANHGTNNGYYSPTPPTNCPLGVDPHVIPLTHVQKRLAGSLLPPTDAVRFERLSATMYDKICLKFNAGPAGKDWRDLAGWVGLNCEDVNRIKLKENKTDHVIRRWAVAAENTVNRFVEILEENEMTCLAHEIRAELNL